MYQSLSDVQKRRLFSSVMAVIILLAVFLGVKSLNALKETSYIGKGVYPSNVISVSGTGEAYTVPDVASFSFSVIEEGKTVKESQDKATTKMNSILAAIKSAGVQDKDIQTTGYNSYPKYEYSNSICANGYCPPSKQTLTGYEVSQTISVKVRKTDTAGDVLTKVGGLGAQNISGLNFVVDNMDSVKAEARDKAVSDAKAKAKVLAKSLGVSLERIVSFSEDGASQPPIMYAMGGATLMKAEAADAVRPTPELPTGENKVVSNITITYEIR
jgi:uncharacterized protein YggE